MVRAQLLGEDVLYSDEEGVDDDFCDESFMPATEPKKNAPTQSSTTSNPGPSRALPASTYEYVLITN